MDYSKDPSSEKFNELKKTVDARNNYLQSLPVNGSPSRIAPFKDIPLFENCELEFLREGGRPITSVGKFALLNTDLPFNPFRRQMKAGENQVLIDPMANKNNKSVAEQPISVSCMKDANGFRVVFKCTKNDAKTITESKFTVVLSPKKDKDCQRRFQFSGSNSTAKVSEGGSSANGYAWRNYTGKNKLSAPVQVTKDDNTKDILITLNIPWDHFGGAANEFEANFTCLSSTKVEYSWVADICRLFSDKNIGDPRGTVELQ
jgi:hypothetical protein